MGKDTGDNMQEEISLKELILILVKGWKLIISTTVLSILISIVGVYLLNSTSHVGELRGRLIRIDQYDTMYGSYRPGYTSIEEQLNQVNSDEFVNLIKSELEIDGEIPLIVTSPDGLNFTIQYSSSDSKVVEPIIKEVQEYLEDYLNYDVQTSAIESIIEHNENAIERELRSIETYQGYIDRYLTKRNQVDKLLSENTINPSYDIIQREITNFELSQILSLERIDNIKTDTELLKTFNYVDFSAYQKGKLKFDDVSVNLKLMPDISISSVSRLNPPLMVAVSAVLGAMLGIFILFFINYWKSN